MARGMERLLFTSLVGLVIFGALWIAADWPLRASIVILLLGGVGTVLAAVQWATDFKSLGEERSSPARPTFDTAAIEHSGPWGTLEIWAWLWGLFAAIHVVGFPVALPLFVLAYVKFYGGGWTTACSMAVATWGFLYGIFEKVLHVPWPPALLGSWL
ncbi:MAG TPA: tripartite tricarboxylate transporter TctB family protein [candidate division Zixibacteria bacterium]|nr:tripartite tricarboxylate transporter TctB family protein [candidate division Zixibacteria bacterium]